MKKVLSVVLAITMVVGLCVGITPTAFAGNEITIINDDMADMTPPDGGVYVNFGGVKDLSQWSQTAGIADSLGLYMETSGTAGYAAATYDVQYATTATVSGYTWRGNYAFEASANTMQLVGPIAPANNMPDSTKLRDMWYDPIAKTAYTQNADGEWFAFLDALDSISYWTFFKCGLDGNPPLPTADIIERLIPYGFSIWYSTDGENFQLAPRRMVTGTYVCKMGGYTTAYDQVEADLPPGTVKVQIRMTETEEIIKWNSLTETYENVSFAGQYTWYHGIGQVTIMGSTGDIENRAPVVENVNINGYTNTAVSGSLNARDPDYDSVTYSVVAQPENGTVALDGAAFTYTPNEGFYGNDHFTYIANDGELDSNIGTVSINIANTAADDSLSIPSVSQLTTPTVISNGAVFQRGKPIRIWGVTVPGREVTVLLHNDNHTEVDWEEEFRGTIAGDNGYFEVEIPAKEASFDTYTLTVFDGVEEEKKVFTDILIGEVWLTAGQSNMELNTQYIVGGKDLMANADKPNLRMYLMKDDPVANGGTPVNPQFDYTAAYWGKGDVSGDVGKCSGVAYTFALDLYNRLNANGENIPVAVLHTSMGALSIEWYMSRRSIERNPEVLAAIGSGYVSKDNWNNNNVQQMSAFFNAKMAPLTGMNIQGFVWYQGENNFGGKGIYEKYLKAMIDDWSKWFRSEDEALPFIEIHLAPHNYNYNLDCGGWFADGISNAWSEFKDTMSQIPIYDISLTHKNPDFAYDHPIHPNDKKPVGDRAGLAAYNMVYSTGNEYTAAVYKSMEVQGNKIVVTFDRVGEGLSIKAGDSELHGFTIAGEDNIFVPAKAKIISNNQVEVSSEFVAEPKNVSYAYTTLNMKSNLFNSIGFPVVPFSTKVNGKQFHPKDWMYADDAQLWANESSYVHGTEGGAYFTDAWEKAPISGSQNIDIAFDAVNKNEGNAALKLSYTGGTFGVGPVLNIAGMDNKLGDYQLMSFDVLNPDARAKTLKGVQIQTNDGAIYTALINGTADGNAEIAQSGEWQTFTVNFNAMLSRGGSLAAGTLPKMNDLRAIQFTFVDDSAGTLYVDNIRFGNEGAVTPDAPKAQVLVSDTFDSLSLPIAQENAMVDGGQLKKAGNEGPTSVTYKTTSEIRAYSALVYAENLSYVLETVFVSADGLEWVEVPYTVIADVDAASGYGRDITIASAGALPKGMYYIKFEIPQLMHPITGDPWPFAESWRAMIHSVEVTGDPEPELISILSDPLDDTSKLFQVENGTTIDNDGGRGTKENNQANSRFVYHTEEDIRAFNAMFYAEHQVYLNEEIFVSADGLEWTKIDYAVTDMTANAIYGQEFAVKNAGLIPAGMKYISFEIPIITDPATGQPMTDDDVWRTSIMSVELFTAEEPIYTEPVITTDLILGEDGIVTGVVVGLTAGEIEAMIQVENGYVTVDGAATGAEVKVYDQNDEVYYTGTIVIFGDVTGDGAVTSDDIIAIKKHISGLQTLEEAYYTAGNASRDLDGAVSSDDIIAVKKHISGLASIAQ